MWHSGREIHVSNEKLNIIYDDIGSQIGYFIQFAQNVTPDLVNFMIKFGRGLVYTCITEEKAHQLKLPILYTGYADKVNAYKNFTVSVDFCTTTTGISAEERAVTIKAFTDPLVLPDDFKRPGHVFPLVSKPQGLLERVGIAEAAVDLAKLALGEPTAFVCEILNTLGEIASGEEIYQLSQEHDLFVIKMSELLRNKQKPQKRLLLLDTRNVTINNRNIVILRLRDKEADSQYIIYLNENAKNANKIVFHNECYWGDVVAESQMCGCSKHFQQYYSELLDGKIDCIVHCRDGKITANNQLTVLDFENGLLRKEIIEFIEKYHFDNSTSLIKLESISN